MKAARRSSGQVSIESWEDELNNSVIVRRAEGSSAIAPWQRQRGSSNAAYLRRAEQRLQNYQDAEAQIIALPAPQGGALGVQSSVGTTWQTVVALSALVAVICSVDRAAMSVALGPMGEHFQWTDTVKGQVSSSFFLGYTVTNFVGGYVATRWSPRLVLSAGVVFWSLFTIATPFAADNLPALLATRAAMGIGEGVTFPAISNLFARWVPKPSLSQALSVAYSGSPVGIIVALLSAPLIIQYCGWPAVFFIFGASGLAWMCAWVPLVGAEPALVGDGASAAGPLARGRAPEVEVEDKVTSLKDVPWAEFARSPPLWALLGVHCSHGVAPLICLSWMPSYYHQEFGLDVAHSAALSILPWGLNVACTNLAGWMGDRAIHERGLDRTLVRKAMQGVASLGPAACLLALSTDQGEGHSVVAAVSLLSATLALGGFQAAGLGSNHQDLAPRYAGILFGITNASASIAGCAGIMATGLLLDATHSWSSIFGIAAGIYCVGYAGFAIWGSAERQFD